MAYLYCLLVLFLVQSGHLHSHIEMFTLHILSTYLCQSMRRRTQGQLQRNPTWTTTKSYLVLKGTRSPKRPLNAPCVILWCQFHRRGTGQITGFVYTPSGSSVTEQIIKHTRSIAIETLAASMEGSRLFLRFDPRRSSMICKHNTWQTFLLLIYFKAVAVLQCLSVTARESVYFFAISIIFVKNKEHLSAALITVSVSLVTLTVATIRLN